jgi:hypothetical protein
MAYVAISKELESAVLDGIRAMSRKEFATIGEVPKLKGTEPFVEAALWGAHVHLKGQIPAEWKRRADRVVLEVKFPEYTFRWTSFLEAQQEAPPMFDLYSPPQVSVAYDNPEVAHIATVVSNQRDAQNRWSAVEKQVLQFLRNCKSLNEGLKLWPDLRMYIPPSYLKRVERKVERSKSESNAAVDALKSMNTEEIVAAAVIARMSTGAVNNDS